MKIGVVSDTHGYFDPRLAEVLAGVEFILHAGDVGRQEVLDELATIAPVRAVRGNVDSETLGLPPSLALSFGNAAIAIQHILPVPQSELEIWAKGERPRGPRSKRRESFLKSFDDGVRVVIFGHSHEPCLVTLSRILFFNPGSAGKKRFALPRTCGVLEIDSHKARASIIQLESSHDAISSEVRLELDI